MEKGMATHSSILVWKIPWTDKPGGLQSMESQRVGHDWATEHTHSNRCEVITHCDFDLHFPNDCAKAFDCVDDNKLWKILKEMGIPDHLTCLLRNPYAGQEATVRTGHGTTDWFQIGKGVCQGWILSPCLFNLYVEYIMRNTGLEEAQLESRLPGKISITWDKQMTPPLWQKLKRN